MQQLVSRLFNASPFVSMRGAPSYKNWSADLGNLAAAPELAVIREALDGLVSNRLATLDPVNDFLQAHARSVSLEALWDASFSIESSVAEHSHAALIASTVLLHTWSVRLDQDLYGQVNGMPEPGWVRHPYVCAVAALKARALDESLRLIDLSVEVLTAAKYWSHPRLAEALARYRELGREVETRWRAAIEDLAFDLRQSCRAQAPNFRAEMGALLWTLGLVPESHLFLPEASAVELPPLRLCRQAVHTSLISVDRDPLTQYIWLGMKDREPFNIRDHTAVFGIFNIRYHTNLLYDVIPEPPSPVFARTLVAWFRGDLNRELASEYLEVFELVQALFPNMDWSIYIRMRLFASMLAKRFGWIQEESMGREDEAIADLVNTASSVNRNAFIHPEWPEMYTRASGPMFSVLQQLTGPDAAARRVSALETFRLGAMQYWLAVASPRPSAHEAEAAAELMDEERGLLEELKGAYFLILSKILPMHYRRSAREIDPHDPDSMKSPDTTKGIDHYKRILLELGELHQRMQPVVPSYAAKRLDAVAGIGAFSEVLGRHRSAASASPR